MRWNGSDRLPSCVDSGQLRATITPAALVTVYNPGPGGGTSQGYPSLTATDQARRYIVGVVATSGKLIQSVNADLYVAF